MCGIFAYLNYGTPQKKLVVLQTLVNGLRRLEYRGYDSAGVCVNNGDGSQLIVKVKGNIDELQKAIDNQKINDESVERQIGIAHTRWATHGAPSEKNAHPQSSDAEHSFVVVHNGIVSNYAPIKESLIKHGYKFVSDTDTEVIAVFLKYVYDNNKNLSLKEIATLVTDRLEGQYALIIKSRHFPGELIATKRGGPLVLGIIDSPDDSDSVPISYVSTSTVTSQAGILLPGSKPDTPAAVAISAVEAKRAQRASPVPLDSESEAEHQGARYVLSSDVAGIIEHTNRAVYLEDDDVACFSRTGRLVLLRGAGRRDTDKSGSRTIETVDLDLDEISKRGFDHFMLKEICEQPESLFNSMRGRINFDTCQITLGGLADHIDAMRRCRRLIFIACGTSYHAAVAVRALMEKLSQLPVDVQLASDFMDRQTPLFRDDSCFFISQSGETADTLQALEYSLQRGAMTVGIVNVVGSSISRLTHCGVYVNAGVEIGVGSTKSYTSQVIVLTLLALYFGQDRRSAQPLIKSIVSEMQRLPALVKEIVDKRDVYRKLAAELTDIRSLLLIGRGYQWATCLEGALKIKEIAYLHCEAIAAGELKHGPLALIDEHLAMMIVSPHDNLFSKTSSAVHQVVARKGNPYVFCTNGDESEFERLNVRKFALPPTHDALYGILHVIPFQLLSYYLAVDKGYNVDMPRNLAKSVTVE